MTPPLPNPADHAFLSLEALRPRPGQTLLTKMPTVKVVRDLQNDHAEPTAGQGWLRWYPGQLLGKFPAKNCRRGQRIVDINGRGCAKSLNF